MAAGFEELLFSLSVEKFADLRKSRTSAGGAGSNGFVNAVEIVPSQGLNSRAQDKVSVALPVFLLMLLRGAESPTDHLEDVRGCSAVSIVQADRNSDDDLGAKLAGGACGYRCDEAAVRQVPSANLNGLEQARESATGTNGVRQTPLFEDDGIAAGQVRRDDCRGNEEVFELT